MLGVRRWEKGLPMTSEIFEICHGGCFVEFQVDTSKKFNISYHRCFKVFSVGCEILNSFQLVQVLTYIERVCFCFMLV